MVRTIAMSIAAFVLSWSPYCLVSIIATIRGTNSLTPSEAEVPDLLAKASVIFNPIVYTVMNDRFRATLLRIIPCGSLFSREVNPASNSVSRSVGSIVDNASSSFDKRRSQRYQNDQNDVWSSLQCPALRQTRTITKYYGLEDELNSEKKILSDSLECSRSYNDVDCALS